MYSKEVEPVLENCARFLNQDKSESAENYGWLLAEIDLARYKLYLYLASNGTLWLRADGHISSDGTVPKIRALSVSEAATRVVQSGSWKNEDQFQEFLKELTGKQALYLPIKPANQPLVA